MAPALAASVTAILTSTLKARKDVAQPDIAGLGPLAARSVLLARSGNIAVDPSQGLIPPTQINNNAVFAIFGILGAAFVVGGIWFFFWAKNGGFVFRKDDWDDYKTTVMRRRGPNGTLLTGATPSTILGGGSVYKDVDDGTTEDSQTVVSGTTGITGVTEGVSDIDGRERRRKKREQKEREKERRREEKIRDKEDRKHGKKSNRKVGADGVLIDPEAEFEAQKHLRSYRHEKPARVGGINKESEGSAWDGSTNPSYSNASGSHAGTTDTGSSATSELISHRERTPTSTPTKKDRESHRERERERERDPEKSAGKPSGGGIRKVYSTADKTSARENERIRAEAKKLAEKGRAAQRRDFSWQRADEDLALRRIDEQTESGVSESVISAPRESRAPRERRVPGSWTDSDVGTGSDVGTKVYHHSVHIPVPSSAPSSSTATSDFAYAEERRKKRAAGGGYRRAPRGET
ncbi:hypothetical protein B0H63DRAFT_307982 [Podospora didyma]|uniref:Endosomal spry domain-containing protein n=1 Tax=Podospora didyma TaxID=330526 RepID=A0AAE0N5F8_9PEZI|nr:hypothetical protein B0H63DRAFT_307982 [Podospora didyma]